MSYFCRTIVPHLENAELNWKVYVIQASILVLHFKNLIKINKVNTLM